MGSEQKPQATTSSRYVCSSCKQPVDAVVERHKTMGVFVPLWTAGPCHNPRCDQYISEQVQISSVRSAIWKNMIGRTRD
ncbi:hypothetical protein [Streptomyces sp. NPDC093598]|uniref:hypothetical protein n=1 Tax=Streptomyces sp. NPDC093598 TaxID=3366046 RepID=UPI00381D5816